MEAIYRRWGYDFRDYAPASLKRRIRRIVELEGMPSVSALQDRVLRDSACMQRFLVQSTVSVTSMFRDPSFYRSERGTQASSSLTAARPGPLPANSRNAAGILSIRRCHALPIS